MQSISNPSKGTYGLSFYHGARQALPIVMGYLPVAFTFGVLAQKAGLSPLEAGLMSLLVFAGSGQLIAVNLLLMGFSPFSVISTTFVVNARHLLMSAALAPYLKHWSKKKQMLFCSEMTDETFALNIGRFAEQLASHPLGRVDGAEAFGVNITSHLAWILGGVTGALFGELITDLRPYGLDFALAGMFIALLMPHLKIPRNLATAIISAVLSVTLRLGGVEQWNVLIATISAATVCQLLPFPDERRNNAPAPARPTSGEAQ